MLKASFILFTTVAELNTIQLRDPWTARRSNQLILKEINLEYSLEGLMMKLKFQHLGHLMQRANSLQKALMLGKIEGRKRKGRQRTRCLDDITNSMDMSLSKLQQMVKDREAWHAAVHEVAKSWTQLSNRTTIMQMLKKYQKDPLKQNQENRAISSSQKLGFSQGSGNPNSSRILLTEYRFFTSMYYHYFISVCSFINRHPDKKKKPPIPQF